MSAYAPPSNSNSTFNNTNFNYQNNLSSSSALDALYVKYPITQGSLQVKGNLTTQGNVNITGTLIIKKPITAPTTWTAPIAGQVGFTISGTNTTPYTMTTATYQSLTSIALPIGVWFVQYSVFVSTLPTAGSITSGISNATTTITISPENVGGFSGTSLPASSGSAIISVSTATTYYLNTIGYITTGSYILNSGSYSLTATRIA